MVEKEYFTVNAGELKKEYAFLDLADLLYTLRRDVDYLESHNKNYTNKQYRIICGLQAVLKNMEVHRIENSSDKG